MINADDDGSAVMYDNSTWQRRRVAVAAVDSGGGQWHRQSTGTTSTGVAVDDGGGQWGRRQQVQMSGVDR